MGSMEASTEQSRVGRCGKHEDGEDRGPRCGAGGVAGGGPHPGGGVMAAGFVMIKGLITDSCVVAIAGAVKERSGTDGRISEASPVIIERVPSYGGVIITIIEEKRSKSITGVSVAGCVGEERAKSIGYVVVANRIVKQRLGTERRAMIARLITEKRSIASGGVLVAGGVAMECLETNGHIPDSGGEAKESVSALRRVLVSIASVRWWVNRLHCG